MTTRRSLLLSLLGMPLLAQGVQSLDVVVASPREMFADDDAKTTLFRLRGNENIYAIGFGAPQSLYKQGLTFNRLVALYERNGTPQDRVLTDDELSSLYAARNTSVSTFVGGNDFQAKDLRRFYAIAPPSVLNNEERQLRVVLERLGFMRANSEQVMLSFPKEQPDDPATSFFERVNAQYKRTVISHELAHGVYFTDAGYRRYCADFWQQLGDEDRTLILNMLEAFDYDIQNNFLVLNEMQAMIGHSPYTQVRRHMSEDKYGELHGRFLARSPIRGFLDQI